MAINPKILIVDDELRFCDSIKRLLSVKDYEVDTCHSGNEALNFLIKNEIDLVLLDVFMEGMDGFQVIKTIMDQKIDTSAVIMTGNSSTKLAVKALRMGAVDYLKKPFEPEELYTSLKNILKQRALKRKLQEGDKRYETLVHIIPQGIQISDLDGKITFSNPAHHQIHGYPEGSLIGKYIWDLIAKKDDQIKTKEYYNFLINNLPKPERYFTADKTKNGNTIHTQIDWDYIFDSKGKPTGIISAITDITEQKQAEKGREKILKALQGALENVKTLSGLLPICAHCKKIRDDKGYWNKIEAYVEKHSNASFSHGMCPECLDLFYDKEDWYLEMKNKR
ncbi:MAG: response regulator [Deltaproteobacteria bacterium]|nr:response regulator [Deltaproteobacteria bacterium]